jgi:diketogulonate reductase-like aldo/keto reductase
MVSADVVPIPGTKHRDRLEENLGAVDVRLDADDLARIADACPPEMVKGSRYGDMTTVGGVTVTRQRPTK